MARCNFKESLGVAGLRQVIASKDSKDLIVGYSAPYDRPMRIDDIRSKIEDFFSSALYPRSYLPYLES